MVYLPGHKDRVRRLLHRRPMCGWVGRMRGSQPAAGFLLHEPIFQNSIVRMCPLNQTRLQAASLVDVYRSSSAFHGMLPQQPLYRWVSRGQSLGGETTLRTVHARDVPHKCQRQCRTRKVQQIIEWRNCGHCRWSNCCYSRSHRCILVPKEEEAEEDCRRERTTDDRCQWHSGFKLQQGQPESQLQPPSM